MHLIAGGHRDGAQIEKLLNARRRHKTLGAEHTEHVEQVVQASLIAAL